MDSRGKKDEAQSFLSLLCTNGEDQGSSGNETISLKLEEENGLEIFHPKGKYVAIVRLDAADTVERVKRGYDI